MLVDVSAVLAPTVGGETAILTSVNTVRMISTSMNIEIIFIEGREVTAGAEVRVKVLHVLHVPWWGGAVAARGRCSQ